MRMKVPPSFVRTAQFILKALIRLLMAVLLIAFIAICVLSSKWALQASAVATIIMAAVTAAMAYYTQESVKEARVTRQEAEQLRKQLVFQKTLVRLCKTLGQYRQFFLNHIVMGNLTLNLHALKQEWDIFLLRYKPMTAPFELFGYVQEFCEQVLLPPELLARLLGQVTYINWLIDEFDTNLDKLIPNANQQGQVPNITLQVSQLNQALLNTAKDIAYFLLQLICYCIAEARKQGFQEIADAFSQVECVRDRSWIQNYSRPNPTDALFHTIPPEPADYPDCQMSNI